METKTGSIEGKGASLYVLILMSMITFIAILSEMMPAGFWAI